VPPCKGLAATPLVAADATMGPRSRSNRICDKPSGRVWARELRRDVSKIIRVYDVDTSQNGARAGSLGFWAYENDRTMIQEQPSAAPVLMLSDEYFGWSFGACKF
jgi:hypothetical protein